MVTENNSQINSFIKGLDSDTSIDKVDETKYIDAKNIRVLSYGDNGKTNLNGIIKPINGIKQLDNVINDNVYKILAAGSVRNYGAIVYISREDDGYKFCVAKFQNVPNSDNYIKDLNTIFRSDMIDWPEDINKWPSRVSISFKYESEDNIKMYIATGFNPIIILNLAKDSYDSDVTIDDLSSYPKILFNKPIFLKYVSGQLKPGMVRYSYLLYSDYGVSTEMSPSCLSIPVLNVKIDNDIVLEVIGLKFDEKTNCGILILIKDDGYQKLLNKIKVYRVTTMVNGLTPLIEIIYDSDFRTNDNGEFILNDTGENSIDKISIEEYNSISGVHIIPKTIESKDDMLFAANIKDALTFIDEDKFKKWDARAFRGNARKNIVLTDSSTGEKSTYSFDNVEKLSLSTSKIDIESFNEINDINKNDFDNLCLYDSDLYFGGEGVNVLWRFVITLIPIDTCPTGGRSIGTFSNILKTSYRPFSPLCYFVHKDNGLVKISANISNEQGRIDNSWITKSLRRDELYRYGIILYDKYGCGSPVKWIADIRTPALYDKGFNTFVSHFSYSYKDASGKNVTDVCDLASMPLGIAFNVKNLPDGCTGYEIVRCKRGEADTATIMLGVISKPTIAYKCPATQRTESNVYFPTGMLTTATVIQGTTFKFFTSNFNPGDDDAYINAGHTCLSNIANNSIFLFVSPEICYLPNSMKMLFKHNNFRIEQLRYLYGCRAYNEDDTEIGSVDVENISLYKNDYYKRYFIRPSISNSAYVLQDDKSFRNYYTNTSSPSQFTTQKYWIKMQSSLPRSMYFKINFSDGYKLLGSLTPGVYDRSIFTLRCSGSSKKTSNRFTDLTLSVYAYIKLYELADWVNIRYIGNPKLYSLYDDSIITGRKISLFKPKLDINDIQIASDLKWDLVINYKYEEKGSNSNTVNNGRWWPLIEYQNHFDLIGPSLYCNAVFYGVDGMRLDKGGNLADDPWTLANDIINGSTNAIDAYKTNCWFYKDDKKLGSLITTENYVGYFPYGSGGRCALISVKDNYDTNSFGSELGAKKLMANAASNNQLDEIELRKNCKYGLSGYEVEAASILGTSLCNIRRNVVPYGGHSINAISSSVYYSNGQYFKETNKWNAVFDGDVYISVLDYTAQHKAPTNFTKDVDAYKKRTINDYRSISMMLQYAIPIESTINCMFSQGFEFSRNSDQDGATLILCEPSDIDGLYSLTDPEYVFNTAYSSEDTSSVKASYDYNNEKDFSKSVDFRCYNSLRKENDEHIDSWSKFLSSNFIDVDSRYGGIQDIKHYGESLVFWQNFAVGLIPVNLRSTVTDNNSNELIIGSGGVLDRYDYLDTTSGMSECLFCHANSTKTLYWFDSVNNEIKALNGNTIISLDKSLYVHNIINKYKDTDKTPDILYDDNNNELIFKVLDKDNSISFNESANLFLSIYTIPFNKGIVFDDNIYLTNIDNGLLRIAKWDAKNQYTTSWGNKYASAYVSYVVNKNLITTKVFDNQEIVTPQDELKDYFDVNHNYSWSTETSETSDTLEGKITNREHNYRYSIPRYSANGLYGSRMRGKYLICSIENTKPNTDIAISCIITKFRMSCS